MTQPSRATPTQIISAVTRPVLSQFSVGRFYDTGYPSTSSTYEKLLTTIDPKKIKFITPSTGQTIDLDPAVRSDVIYPDGSNKGEIHDNMLVLRLSKAVYPPSLPAICPTP